MFPLQRNQEKSQGNFPNTNDWFLHKGTSQMGYVRSESFSYEIFHSLIKCLYKQVFIQALLSTAIFSQRFSFFSVCLAQQLHDMAP